jgi:hypothetical protein
MTVGLDQAGGGELQNAALITVSCQFTADVLSFETS